MNRLQVFLSAAVSTLVVNQLSFGSTTPFLTCVDPAKSEQNVLELSRVEGTSEVIATVPSAPTDRVFHILYTGYPGYPDSNLSFYLGLEKNSRHDSMLEFTSDFSRDATGNINGLLRIGDNFHRNPQPIAIGKYYEIRVQCKGANQ